MAKMEPAFIWRSH